VSGAHLGGRETAYLQRLPASAALCSRDRALTLSLERGEPGARIVSPLPKRNLAVPKDEHRALVD
jgi:hypothetical protein